MNQSPQKFPTVKFPNFNKKTTSKNSFGKKAKTASPFYTEMNGGPHISQRDAMQNAMRNELKGKNPFNYPKYK